MNKLGFSGATTRLFIQSPMTPLILLASLLFGAIALIALPREEEPQISVPMVDIHILADGLKAEDAVELVTKPMEDIVKGIDGVEHVYAQTQDDRVVVTARFFVGTDSDDAILRIHEKIRRNYDRIPVGIPEPLVIGLGIDDVAVLVLTLAPQPDQADRWNDAALYDIAEELQHELGKVTNIGYTYIVSGRPQQVRVEPDPERLALYGITLNQLVEKVRNANRSFRMSPLRERDHSLPTVAGQTLSGIPDIGQLVMATHDGRPVYVNDVADVYVGGRPDEHRAWTLAPDGAGKLDRRPAVSIAFAKRRGASATTVADEILARLEQVRGDLVPAGVEVAVTRNYGETAQQKSDELLSHLVGATVTIVLVIAIFVGWREGFAVLVVVPATILLTFCWSWIIGYTINRVSLFALIFAIGILVDDAIVVVENITRHWHMRDGRSRIQAAIDGVAEIGNPTIIATLTIVAALLPMMFVSGMMGPYMAPIPVNASAAVLLSLILAITVTPWLMRLLGRFHRPEAPPAPGAKPDAETTGGILGRIFLFMARPLLRGRRRSVLFLALTTVATIAVLAMFGTRNVTVKLLPFDDKPELQVVVDLPEGASLEATERTLMAAADRLADLPELVSIQAYAGVAAPFNFNGLVRHYYLRGNPEQGDLQLNLLPKDDRDRQSHAIALEVRERLAGLDAPAGTTIKVSEVPPGPPVIATLLAEVYGPDAETRRTAARQIRQAYEDVDFIVDVDDSIGERAPRLRFSIDQEELEFHGVEQQAVYDTLRSLLDGVTVGYSHRGFGTNPIEITVRLSRADLYLGERLMTTPVPARTGNVELGDVVQVTREPASYPIFRRNGRYAEMVTGELAGRYEAPIYGMLEVADRLADNEATKNIVERFYGQPDDESVTTLLWDGEWEITYVTFRDLGIAFAAAMLMIYILVVALFQNFRLPLVILVPIPLTFIGIMLGHWLLSAAFTATSMIGFIALAGIIVRNSILLVDFVRARRAEGKVLRHALLEAGAIRFKPIFLTAFTAQIGAAFILFDPIFQGLAISLLFGLASSTLLTVLVIPAIYIIFRDDKQDPDIKAYNG